jgi:hypothetical protein
MESVRPNQIRSGNIAQARERLKEIAGSQLWQAMPPERALLPLHPDFGRDQAEV